MRSIAFKAEPGHLYTAEESDQGELPGHRLALLRAELIDPAPLACAAKSAIQNPLEPPTDGNVFPPLDRALTGAIPPHLIDRRVCEWKDGFIKLRFPSSVIGSAQQRRTQAIKDSRFYVTTPSTPKVWTRARLRFSFGKPSLSVSRTSKNAALLPMCR